MRAYVLECPISVESQQKEMDHVHKKIAFIPSGTTAHGPEAICGIMRGLVGARGGRVPPHG